MQSSSPAVGIVAPFDTDRSLVHNPNGAQSQIISGLALPTLLQYWQVLLRWRWVIIGIVFATVAIGLVATILATPQYSAISRIEISRDQKKITNLEGLDSSEAGRDLEFYQTQYSLLKARSLAERVARQLRLADNSKFFAAHGASYDNSSLFTSKEDDSARSDARLERDQKVIALLQDHIAISPIRGSALIDITYSSASPAISALVANTWTEQFVLQRMDRRFSSTADARKFLENRLADLRIRLDLSERALVNYASEKGIVALGKTKSDSGKTVVERTLVSSDLEAANASLAQATAVRIAAESRARERGGGSNSEALNNAAISQLRQKRAEVASEYAKMLVQFEPGFPGARALAEQERVLAASITREESRVASSRANEFGESLQRERALRAKVQQLKLQMDRQQRDSIQYNIYQREADTNRELYDGLLQRYKEIGIAGIGTNNLSVVDRAEAPNKPSSPNVSLNLALSLIAGLGLAALATFALDQIDEGLRDPSQVTRLLEIPLLGGVPQTDGVGALQQLLDSKSMLTEAYLSIRSSLAFSTDHGVPRAFMVTSTRPAEGKSTSSYGLAIVLGRTGKKVLLIDADMRSPSMHQFMNQANVAGLSNFLAGDTDWQRLLTDTVVKGVSLMAAGPPPPSASELLSGDRMVMLVRQSLELFDHVIIDSPPILGLADAPLLSRAVEGCIFVAEAEGVPLRGIKASLGRLQSVHAHVFGVILTKIKHRDAGYGYGYGYGYGETTDRSTQDKAPAAAEVATVRPQHAVRQGL